MLWEFEQLIEFLLGGDVNLISASEYLKHWPTAGDEGEAANTGKETDATEIEIIEISVFLNISRPYQVTPARPKKFKSFFVVIN